MMGRSKLIKNWPMRGLNYFRREWTAKRREAAREEAREEANPRRRRDSEVPLRYIHIGYPKAASTALQKGFFAWHSHLCHLGCGTVCDKGYWDDHGYIDSAVNVALEVDLRYRNEYSYVPEQTAAAFEPHFQEAREDPFAHAVGISNENLCFNWHGGIDTPTKARRLFEIFGPGTRIVAVVRNQRDLIASLYKESIRFGYDGSFAEYLEYIWTYQDRNFFHDFCSDRVLGTYASLFGRENVVALPFEALKEDSGLFVKDLCKAIGVDHHEARMDENYNPQLSGRSLTVKRDLNRQFRHTFGRGVYTPCDTHRFVPYLTQMSGGTLGIEHHTDYWVRQELCRAAEKIAERAASAEELRIEWDGEFAERLLGAYAAANERLVEFVDRADLARFGYLPLG